MIIEFQLQGSKMLHKGLFDTDGVWIKFEAQYCDEYNIGNPNAIDGYKIYSNFSFAFYHTDKAICDLVYSKLVSVLRGSVAADIEDVGYIRKLNK